MTPPPAAGNLVFWQNMPSLHQAPLVRQITSLWPASVSVVVESGLSEERRNSGWATPSYGAAQIIANPCASVRRRLESECDSNTVHVFSGIKAYPETAGSLQRILVGDAKVFLYLEPWDPRGFTGSVRAVRYARWCKSLDGRVTGILTTGKRGMAQYMSAGFRKSAVIPFGYFTEVAADLSAAARRVPTAARSADSSVRLIFVGSLVPGKGLDQLFRTLGRFLGRSWTLDIVGSGPHERRLHKLAAVVGVNARLRWLGPRPNDLVQAAIAASDALILPSRYDGWGAVINEALSLGTRVVVSQAAGASDLVDDGMRGRVFDWSLGSLDRAMESTLVLGVQDSQQRQRLAHWAAAHISPDRGARYLADILTRDPSTLGNVIPPWRMRQNGSSMIEGKGGDASS